MKKIDYALDNLPYYWRYMDKNDILTGLCPCDFDLRNHKDCDPMVSYQPCKECRNEEIGE